VLRENTAFAGVAAGIGGLLEPISSVLWVNRILKNGILRRPSGTSGF
jgi:hypothetical protein